jgi:hypothetical protein
LSKRVENLEKDQLLAVREMREAPSTVGQGYVMIVPRGMCVRAESEEGAEKSVGTRWTKPESWLKEFVSILLRAIRAALLDTFQFGELLIGLSL